jgi:hypothetical protein
MKINAHMRLLTLYNNKKTILPDHEQEAEPKQQHAAKALTTAGTLVPHSRTN